MVNDDGITAKTKQKCTFPLVQLRFGGICSFSVTHVGPKEARNGEDGASCGHNYRDVSQHMSPFHPDSLPQCERGAHKVAQEHQKSGFYAVANEKRRPVASLRLVLKAPRASWNIVHAEGRNLGTKEVISKQNTAVLTLRAGFMGIISHFTSLF